MSKSRYRKTKQGRGYSPKSSQSHQNRKNKLLVILLLSAAALAVIFAVYWFTRSKEVTTTTGLKYVDEVVGNGEVPLPGKTVVVHYTGKLVNGTQFDSSVDRNQPLEFPIGKGEVIKGWDEGIMTMKVGGKRKLIVPPALGYGSRDKGPIPANSTLIFDVELLGVK